MKSADIVEATRKILSEYGYALTLRQIFYRLVSNYGLSNTGATYRYLSRILVNARENGIIPVNSIIDRSRSIIPSYDNDDGDPDDYFDLEIESIEDMALSYSMSMWDNQDYYIEVWVEKDALSQVVSRVARDFKVVVAPSRGYSSFSYLYDAVKRFKSVDSEKNRLVLHFGDHDPSGIDMSRDLEERLNNYGANIELVRVALTYDQVKQYKLSPNPTKTADPRSNGYISMFGSECWELDALPPNVLQKLVSDSIQSYIDKDKWEAKEDEIEDNRQIIQDKVDEFFDKARRS